MLPPPCFIQQSLITLLINRNNIVIDSAHQHICGGNRRAVLDDAVHLLGLCSGSGGLCLLSDRVGWVLTSWKTGQNGHFQVRIQRGKTWLQTSVLTLIRTRRDRKQKSEDNIKQRLDRHIRPVPPCICAD